MTAMTAIWRATLVILDNFRNLGATIASNKQMKRRTTKIPISRALKILDIRFLDPLLSVFFFGIFVYLFKKYIPMLIRHG